MLYAKMVAIRGIEIDTGGTKIVLSGETLPDFGYGFVVLGQSTKDPILKKVQVRGQPKAVKAVLYPLTLFRVLFRHFLWSPEFTDGDGVTERSNLIDELRYETGEKLLFVEKC